MSILWNFDKYAKIEALPFDPSCINENDLIPISDVELLLKAGTPLVESSGVVAPLGEDDDPTCFAAEDYHFILTDAQQTKLVKCVTKGYIEKAKVLAAMGVLVDPTADWAEDLAALGLYLVDELGALPGSGGGGSGAGGLLVVGVDASSPSRMVMDKTWKEIADSDFAVCFIATPSGRAQAYITTISEGAVGVVAWNNSADAFSALTFHAESDDSYPHTGTELV